MLLATSACLVLTFGICADAESQLSGRRSQVNRTTTTRSDSKSSLPQHLQQVYNPGNLPLRRLQIRRIERIAEKDQQEAVKKGVSVQQVVDQRMQRARTFAAIARGLSAGLTAASASAAAYNTQSQIPATPARATGSGETRNQWLWRQYNRNYGNDTKYFYLNQMR